MYLFSKKIHYLVIQVICIFLRQGQKKQSPIETLKETFFLISYQARSRSKYVICKRFINITKCIY